MPQTPNGKEEIMTHQLKKWTTAQTASGQKVSDIWQKYFQAERKDSILRADEFCETARIQEVQDKRHCAG